MKKAIILILAIILYNCARTPNPFTPAKNEVLEIKEPFISSYNINTWDRKFDISFYIYSSYYKNQPYNIVSAIGSWDGFKNSVSGKDSKNLDIEYISESFDSINIQPDIPAKGMLTGFVFKEFVNLPDNFVTNLNEDLAPEIIDIQGPNGGDFTRENQPDIYIIARDYAPSSGFTIPRYYTIIFQDIYGHKKEYFKIFRPVRISMRFDAINILHQVYFYNNAEIVGELPGGAVRIKVSFPPEKWGTYRQDGFFRNTSYILQNFIIFDLAGNSWNVWTDNSRYFDGYNYFGNHIINFTVK